MRFLFSLARALHERRAGEEAEAAIDCVLLAAGRQSLDLHSSITHAAENAVSRQQHRNLVADRAEAIFKGRIKVAQVRCVRCAARAVGSGGAGADAGAGETQAQRYSWGGRIARLNPPLKRCPELPRVNGKEILT